VTTRNGLWRYRLGDVIEIAGFHPADGTPTVRYVERCKYITQSCMDFKSLKKDQCHAADGWTGGD